jgi:hypothetical protein
MQVLSINRKKRIHAIAFAPGGHELAGACSDGFLRVWDLQTGTVRQTIPIEETSCGYDLAYLDPDRLIFAGIGLRWWDIPANGWNVIVPQMRWARQIALSPDGRYLAEVDSATSTEWGGSGLRVYDTAAWQPVPALADATHTTGGLAFSPDGRLLATGHIVRVGDRMRSFSPLPGRYPVPDYDYVVRLRDVPAGDVVRSVGGWQQPVSNLAFSPDGTVLAGTAGPRLRVWDLAGDRELAVHKRGDEALSGPRLHRRRPLPGHREQRRDGARLRHARLAGAHDVHLADRPAAQHRLRPGRPAGGGRQRHGAGRDLGRGGLDGGSFGAPLSPARDRQSAPESGQAERPRLGHRGDGVVELVARGGAQLLDQERVAAAAQRGREPLGARGERRVSHERQQVGTDEVRQGAARRWWRPSRSGRTPDSSRGGSPSRRRTCRSGPR